MVKLALLVGIDAYPGSPLSGCVNDANSVHDLLARHHDGAPNFECRTLLAPSNEVTCSSLREHLEYLFTQKADVALFFLQGTARQIISVAILSHKTPKNTKRA